MIRSHLVSPIKTSGYRLGYPLNVLAKAMDKVRYEELDLTKIV
jgi:hypothetical protein